MSKASGRRRPSQSLRAGLAAAVVAFSQWGLVACGSSSPPGTISNVQTSLGVASPVPPTPSASAPITVHCDGAPAAGSRLVLARLVGSTDVVVRDLTDPDHARTVCSFPGSKIQYAVFAGRNDVLVTPAVNFGTPNHLYRVDLISGQVTTIASWMSQGFNAGLAAASADGSLVTYITSDATAVTWHLVQGGTDRVLDTLGPVPARDIDPWHTAMRLGVAPDGRHVSFLDTLATPSSVLEVRSPEGGLDFRQSGSVDSAVWVAGPALLYGQASPEPRVDRWPAAVAEPPVERGLDWISPVASPDGATIAFSVVGDRETQHVFTARASGRSDPRAAGNGLGALPAFLTNNLLWYPELKPCPGNSMCYGGERSGSAVVHDLASATTSASRIDQYLDGIG